MEYLFYYFIAALSFSMMYYWNYNRDTVWSIEKICVIFDLDMREYFTPSTYYIVSFGVVFFAFPVYLYSIIRYKKADLIKIQAVVILKEYFGLDPDDL